MKPSSMGFKRLAVIVALGGAVLWSERDAHAQTSWFETDDGGWVTVWIDPSLPYGVDQIETYLWRLVRTGSSTQDVGCNFVTAQASTTGPGVGGVSLVTRCIGAGQLATPPAEAMCGPQDSPIQTDGGLVIINPDVEYEVVFLWAPGDPVDDGDPGCNGHGRPIGNCGYRVRGTANLFFM